MEILLGLLGEEMGVLFGLLGIAVAIFFGLRGFRLQILPTLARIEEHTSSIKDIKEIVIRLEERTKHTSMKGTVEGILKNLGKVKVTADPGRKETEYYIEIEKPVLKEGPIEKISSETGLSEKEKQLFGQEPIVRLIDSTRIACHLPCIDPQKCSEYITFFLKWLDSKYYESLKEVEQYEKISF